MVRERFGVPRFFAADAVEEFAREVEVAQAEEVSTTLREACRRVVGIVGRKGVEEFLERLGLEQHGVGGRVEVVEERRAEPGLLSSEGIPISPGVLANPVAPVGAGKPLR